MKINGKKIQDRKLHDFIFIYLPGRKYSKLLTMLIFRCWEYSSFKFSFLCVSVLPTLSMNNFSNKNVVSAV